MSDTLFDLDGPGQARWTDPRTSHDVAQLVRARAGTARIALLEAHARNPQGLTDEQAAMAAGLWLRSEYATRCSELVRLGVLADTDQTERGEAGALRMVRTITDLGRAVLAERRFR